MDDEDAPPRRSGRPPKPKFRSDPPASQHPRKDRLPKPGRAPTAPAAAPLAPTEDGDDQDDDDDESKIDQEKEDEEDDELEVDDNDNDAAQDADVGGLKEREGTAGADDDDDDDDDDSESSEDEPRIKLIHSLAAFQREKKLDLALLDRALPDERDALLEAHEKKFSKPPPKFRMSNREIEALKATANKFGLWSKANSAKYKSDYVKAHEDFTRRTQLQFQELADFASRVRDLKSKIKGGDGPKFGVGAKPGRDVGSKPFATLNVYDSSGKLDAAATASNEEEARARTLITQGEDKRDAKKTAKAAAASMNLNAAKVVNANTREEKAANKAVLEEMEPQLEAVREARKRAGERVERWDKRNRGGTYGTPVGQGHGDDDEFKSVVETLMTAEDASTLAMKEMMRMMMTQQEMFMASHKEQTALLQQQLASQNDFTRTLVGVFAGSKTPHLALAAPPTMSSGLACCVCGGAVTSGVPGRYFCSVHAE